MFRDSVGREAAVRSVARCAGALVLAVALAGCAAHGTAREGGVELGPDAGTELELVAVDLVSVMMQLPTLSPFSTTLQFSPPPSAFGETLERTLRDSGYGVQRVSDDQGRHYVSYHHRLGTAPSGTTIATYRLRVAGIEVERDYRRARRGDERRARFVPASAVRVIGTVPTPVVVNDDLYRGRADAGEGFLSGVLFLDADGVTLARRERIVRAGESAARASGERIGTERFLVLARANLFHADRLHATPDEHEGERRPMWQVTLHFDGAESLHLGSGNKRALARLRARFDAGADRLSITGCSHGKSLLWDGTESQSLARSQRVKEELLLGGVPGRLLREEGCFGTRYGDVLSPNAVLVTLERYPGAQLRAGRQTSGSSG